MDNVVDLTLRKILRIAKALSIFGTIFYLIGGIMIFFMTGQIVEYVYLIVGIDMIIVAFIDLLREIVNKKIKEEYNHIGTAIFTIIVGILILTVFRTNIYKVSVMWAVATVVNSMMEINEGLHEIHEKKAFAIINLVFAVLEIVFSVWLLIEPEENEEHLMTHIYLLGAGFLLEAAEELISIFSPLIAKVKVSAFIPNVQQLAIEREEEIQEYKEETKKAKKARMKKKKEKAKKQEK